MNLERVDDLWVRSQDESTDHSVLTEQRNDVYGLGALELDGATVVDLGANIGAVSVACARAGAARVIAVEPDAENFLLLAANAVGWSAIEPRYAAVGWHLCYVPMVGHSGGAHVKPGAPTSEHPATGLVQVVTLAHLVADVTGDIALLKVDIEGAEFPTMHSCSFDLLRRFDRIVMELHGPRACPWVIEDRRPQLVAHLTNTHDVTVEPHETMDVGLLVARRKR